MRPRWHRLRPRARPACGLSWMVVWLLWATAGEVRAGELEAVVRDAEGAALPHAVIALYADGVPAAFEPTDAAPSAVMDQKQMQFVPHVLAVRVGTRVTFPNSDAMRHHVYSFSPAKPFQLKLYAGEPADPVTFDRVGTVVLGCNIHDEMIGYIYVVATPLFAVTDSEGRARLERVAAGHYRLELWHPASEGSPVARDVEVAAEGATREALVLDATPRAPRERELSPLEKRFRRGTRP